jgi:hypothetical protein
MDNQVQEIIKLVDDFLNNAPSWEVEELFDKIDKMDIQGPTVDEYFSALDEGLCRAQDELEIYHYDDFLLDLNFEGDISPDINYNRLTDLGSMIAKKGISLRSIMFDSINFEIAKNKKNVPFDNTFNDSEDPTFSQAA